MRRCQSREGNAWFGKKKRFAFPGGARCVACTIRYKSRRRALDPTQQVGRQTGSGSGLRIVRFCEMGLSPLSLGEKKRDGVSEAGWQRFGWIGNSTAEVFSSFLFKDIHCVVFCFFISFFFSFFFFSFLLSLFPGTVLSFLF